MTSKRIIPKNLTWEEYEHPQDKAAMDVLKILKPVEYMGRFFIREFAEPWMKSKLIGHGVKVSEKQLPHILKIAQEAAEILNVDMPELFVMQNPYLNAYTVGVHNRNVIVLHHSLIEAFTNDELLFIIGHEMGHIKSEHVLYLTLSKWMSEGVSIFLRWAVIPAQTAIWAWQRKSELTADRAGLITIQDSETACNALVKLALGSVELFNRINVEEFIRDQLMELSEGPVKSWPEIFQSHPYIPKRLGQLIAFGESEQYKKLLDQ